MDQANLIVQMDADIKKRFEEFCADVGMNVAEIVNLFARAVLREKRVPFDYNDLDILAGAAPDYNDDYSNLVLSLAGALHALQPNEDYNDLIAQWRLEDYENSN